MEDSILREDEIPDESPVKPIRFQINQVVYYILGVLEVLLLLRFLFRLFGANAANPFIGFIGGLTDVFVSPFGSIFPIYTAERAVFEWATLIAMLIYALLFWGVAKLVVIVFARRRSSTEG